MTESAPLNPKNSSGSEDESQVAPGRPHESHLPSDGSSAAVSKPLPGGATRVDLPPTRSSGHPAAISLLTPKTGWRAFGLLLATVGTAGLFMPNGTMRNVLSALFVPGLVFAVLPPPWNNKLVAYLGLILGFVGALSVPATIVVQGAGGSKAKLPSCSDVGNSSSTVKDTNYSGAFRRAYDRAGGIAVLGCPRNDDTSGFVHRWGEGYSQDLLGADGYPARLMVLPPSGRVLVLKGTLNRDYTNQFDRNSAPQLGYPISEPVQCGTSRIVRLDKGIWAPGAMVTSSDTEIWVWLARPFWQRYEELGGPAGRLGRPVGQSDPTEEEPTQQFEHGWLLLAPDKRTVRTDREVSGLREAAPTRRLPCVGR
jgi:hypothetical protein